MDSRRPILRGHSGRSQVVNADALAGGTLPEASIVGLASASFSLP